MTFDPQKFFIGVVDFFAVLMPGALLAYFGRDLAASFLVGTHDFKFDGAQNWMVFLFASYLLGHFVFLLGSLLDEYFCDPFLKCAERGQIKRLADSKAISSAFLRWLVQTDLFSGKSGDKALMQAERIKNRTLLPVGAAGAINAFQWSKALLSKENSAGLVAVQRFEADSKFFRSLVVALAVLMTATAIRGGHLSNYEKGILAAVCLLGLLLALWRYIELRSKMTQQAYWFVIALEGAKSAAGIPATTKRSDGLTHAGGVVYRMHAGVIEFLLVEGEKNRKEWVLPKGHIEAGEEPRETAVREVKEETQHWAKVEVWLQDTSFAADGSSLERFFLMEDQGAAGEDPRKECRQHLWLPIADAQRQATYPETRELLAAADATIKSGQSRVV